MNLWFRLVWLALSCLWRGGLGVPQEASVIHSRVWFNDLDPFGHMNNGRYLTLMDLGRTDLMVRSGLAGAAVAHKWTPIASAVLIRFRRELKLLQKFRIETRIVYWNERLAVLEQVFVFEGGAYDGQVAARALFKGGLYDRPSKQFIPVARLMAEVGVAAPAPRLTGEIAAYLNADEEMKRTGRTGAEA